MKTCLLNKIHMRIRYYTYLSFSILLLSPNVLFDVYFSRTFPIYLVLVLFGLCQNTSYALICYLLFALLLQLYDLQTLHFNTYNSSSFFWCPHRMYYNLFTYYYSNDNLDYLLFMLFIKVEIDIHLFYFSENLIFVS